MTKNKTTMRKALLTKIKNDIINLSFKQKINSLAQQNTQPYAEAARVSFIVTAKNPK